MLIFPLKARFGIHLSIFLRVYVNVRMPGKFSVVGDSLLPASKSDCQAGMVSLGAKRYLQSALLFVWTTSGLADPGVMAF